MAHETATGSASDARTTERAGGARCSNAIGGFGTLLRDWRTRRRASQLDLALGAGVSARHVSFLETGRARPSRTMVLQLAAELDVPLEARNDWLIAAGLAPAFRRRDADDADIAMAREAVAWMVDRHDPYPGFALDRHWRIVRANGMATRLFEGFGIAEGDSLLDAFLGCEPLREAIANMDEIAAHTRARVATELKHYGEDRVLGDALERLDAWIDPAALRHDPGPVITGAFVPVRYRLGDVRLSFFSTFSHFVSTQDIALAELRVELMFPADEASRDWLLASAERRSECERRSERERREGAA